MTFAQRRGPLFAGALGGTFLVLAAACGGHDTGSAPLTPSPGSTAPSTLSRSPSPKPSSSPSKAPVKHVTYPQISLDIPNSWTIERHAAAAGQSSFHSPRFLVQGIVEVTAGASPGESATKKSINDLAKDFFTGEREVRRPDVFIEGVRFYHFYTVYSNGWSDDYGTIYKGRLIYLDFSGYLDMGTLAHETKLKNLVLSTIQLH